MLSYNMLGRMTPSSLMHNSHTTFVYPHTANERNGDYFLADIPRVKSNTRVLNYSQWRSLADIIQLSRLSNGNLWPWSNDAPYTETNYNKQTK
jgi:hypothetical protein